MSIRPVWLTAFLISLIPAAFAIRASTLPAQDAAPLSASRHDAPTPAALAEPIAAKLAPGGVRVVLSRNSVQLDFWWVAALPLRAGAADLSWGGVEEGTLVGAVNIPAAYRDIRGHTIKPGVYTLRYGLQPADGNHLGVSPYREFLLLSPAGSDTDPAPRGHEGTIEISTLTIGGSHPAVLSMDPPLATAAALQPHKTDLDHDAVIMEVPVTRDGQPAGTLRFGLVLVGRIDA